MTNNTNNNSADISVNGQKVEEVANFKHLGATLCKDGTCSAEVRIRIASTMAAMARLNRIKFYDSLVTSTLLCGCETWTLLADSENKIQTFETQYLRKLLRISYLEHKTSDWVRSKINSLVGPQEPLPAIVKRRKLAWFGHVTRPVSYTHLTLPTRRTV